MLLQYEYIANPCPNTQYNSETFRGCYVRLASPPQAKAGLSVLPALRKECTVPWLTVSEARIWVNFLDNVSLRSAVLCLSLDLPMCHTCRSDSGTWAAVSWPLQSLNTPKLHPEQKLYSTLHQCHNGTPDGLFHEDNKRADPDTVLKNG